MIKREHDEDVLSEDHSIEIPCVKKEEPEVSCVVKWCLCPCVGLVMCVFISQITGYSVVWTNELRQCSFILLSWTDHFKQINTYKLIFLSYAFFLFLWINFLSILLCTNLPRYVSVSLSSCSLCHVFLWRCVTFYKLHPSYCPSSTSELQKLWNILSFYYSAVSVNSVDQGTLFALYFQALEVHMLPIANWNGFCIIHYLNC